MGKRRQTRARSSGRQDRARRAHSTLRRRRPAQPAPPFALRQERLARGLGPRCVACCPLARRGEGGPSWSASATRSCGALPAWASHRQTTRTSYRSMTPAWPGSLAPPWWSAPVAMPATVSSSGQPPPGSSPRRRLGAPRRPPQGRTAWHLGRSEAAEAASEGIETGRASGVVLVEAHDGATVTAIRTRDRRRLRRHGRGRRRSPA
jgi:hypothetical protein